jgi:hypothetical protein
LTCRNYHFLEVLEKPRRISALQLACGLTYGHELQRIKRDFIPLYCNKNINDVKVKEML